MNFKQIFAALTITLCVNAPVKSQITLEQLEATVEAVKKEKAPDKRQNIYEVIVKETSDGANFCLTGKISDRTIYDDLCSRLEANGYQGLNEIVLLPDTLWALVRTPVACMRVKGSYGSELATQAIMGMPMRLLEKDGGWWHVQSPDGYIGWVYGSNLTKMSPKELSEWKKSNRLVVTSLHQIYAYDNPKNESPRDVVTDLVPGSIVNGDLRNTINNKVEIELPDGRKCWADASAFSTFDQWANQKFDEEKILNQAYAMMGAPYLWGGTSAKTTDCSGLVKISYLANGLILRRDASQQALIGMHISPDDTDALEPCDLMFFGDTPGGRVVHVAIYDNDGKFIHCATRVHQSLIDKDDPTFGRRIYMGASRIKGYEGTEGIVRVSNHPWYVEL